MLLSARKCRPESRFFFAYLVYYEFILVFKCDAWINSPRNQGFQRTTIQFRLKSSSWLINSGSSSLRCVAILVSRISLLCHFASLFGDLPVICRRNAYHLYMASSKSWSNIVVTKPSRNGGKVVNLALLYFSASQTTHESRSFFAHLL